MRFLVAILMIFYAIFPVEMVESPVWFPTISTVTETEDPAEDDFDRLRTAESSPRKNDVRKKVTGQPDASTPHGVKGFLRPVVRRMHAALAEQYIHLICTLRL